MLLSAVSSQCHYPWRGPARKRLPPWCPRNGSSRSAGGSARCCLRWFVWTKVALTLRAGGVLYEGNRRHRMHGRHIEKSTMRGGGGRERERDWGCGAGGGGDGERVVAVRYGLPLRRTTCHAGVLFQNDRDALTRDQLKQTWGGDTTGAPPISDSTTSARPADATTMCTNPACIRNEFATNIGKSFR